MHGAFAFDDGALWVLLVLARVALDHLPAFDNDALLFSQDLKNFAALTALGARDHDHFIPSFHMKLNHIFQITSGASEIIFMNFFSRSSRATGPKMRVPRGLFSLSMITIAFVSKRR